MFTKVFYEDQAELLYGVFITNFSQWILYHSVHTFRSGIPVIGNQCVFCAISPLSHSFFVDDYWWTKDMLVLNYPLLWCTNKFTPYVLILFLDPSPQTYFKIRRLFVKDESTSLWSNPLSCVRISTLFVFAKFHWKTLLLRTNALPRNICNFGKIYRLGF